MRTIFALLCLGLCLASRATDNQGPGVVHGWMMELPLCEADSLRYFPAGAQRGNVPGIVVAKDDAQADFGGGNRVYHLKSVPMMCATSPPASPRPHPGYYFRFQQNDYAEGASVPLLEMSGFVRNVTNARVRGEISVVNRFLRTVSESPAVERFRAFQMASCRRPSAQDIARRKQAEAECEAKREELGRNALVLSLEYQADNGRWVTVSRKTDVLFAARDGRHSTWVVEALVPPNTRVKMALYARWGKLSTRQNGLQTTNSLDLLDARMFGARCYPDFAHPERCLK